MLIRRESGTLLEGQLVYSETEYGFRFDLASPADMLEHAGGPDLASVSVGTLQIEVGVTTHRALFVWGLHPRPRWKTAELPDPSFSEGAAILGPEVEYTSGTSIAVSAVGEWTTAHDLNSGWVRVADGPGPEDALIQIASGVLLGSTNNELKSIWLNPLFE